LKQGDIVSARLMLERAANAGNAEAALKLGMTFDQDFLAYSGVRGIAPDTGQARAWYDRANELGSTEAASYLGRLASTPK